MNIEPYPVCTCGEFIAHHGPYGCRRPGSKCKIPGGSPKPGTPSPVNKPPPLAAATNDPLAMLQNMFDRHFGGKEQAHE